jgi:hypothetical protein
MSSMRFSVRLGTYHHGRPHPFLDAGTVADSLTDIIGRTTGSHSTMWYVHDGALASSSRAVRDIFSNTCHYRWIGRGGLTTWPPLPPD